MAYKDWDYYREHLQTYKTFRKHIRALSRKKNEQQVCIDVREATLAIFRLDARKLYYWLLKLIEENLIYGLQIVQQPSEHGSHLTDSETYECKIIFSVRKIQT